MFDLQSCDFDLISNCLFSVVYFWTGKLGGGKTLAAVGRIRDYLQQGRRVATNVDLRLHKMLGKAVRSSWCVRLPDRPGVSDLDLLGRGNDSLDESRNGLIVLDECGTWFNSRTWNDKNRQMVIDWLLHSRKLGWDVIFIIQDISMIDNRRGRGWLNWSLTVVVWIA